MATQGETAIREALVRLGYFPRAVFWVGGKWQIRYAFFDTHGTYFATMHAASLPKALQQIAELGRNLAV